MNLKNEFFRLLSISKINYTMSDWNTFMLATCVDDNGEKYPYTEEHNKHSHKFRKRWHYPDWKGVRREEIWKDMTKEEAREWDRNGKLINEIILNKKQ
jgi:hypothetical protein